MMADGTEIATDDDESTTLPGVNTQPTYRLERDCPAYEVRDYSDGRKTIAHKTCVMRKGSDRDYCETILVKGRDVVAVAKLACGACGKDLIDITGEKDDLYGYVTEGDMETAQAGVE